MSVMVERRLDVLGICETRLCGQGRRTLHKDYHLVYKGREEEKKYGVAIILAPELAERVEQVNYMSDRIVAVVLKLDRGSVGLIQVYAPHQGRPLEEKLDFYEQLQVVYDGLNVENKILMGDFNAHVGRVREGVETVIGAFGVGERNPEGERLLDFAVENGLSIMNTFYKHRESHKWTWYRWNSPVGEYTDKSMIDLVMTNNRRTISDRKSVPSVSLDSDHRLVMARLNLKKPPRTKLIQRERIMVEKLKEVRVRRLRGNRGRVEEL